MSEREHRSVNTAELLRRALAGAQRQTDEPKSWIDNAIEYERRSKELEQEWEAARQAQEPTAPPQPIAALLRDAIALNGAGVLNAAAAAVGGTVHGG